MRMISVIIACAALLALPATAQTPSPPATVADVAWQCRASSVAPCNGGMQAQGFGLKDRGLGFAVFPAARLDGFFFAAARSAAP